MFKYFAPKVLKLLLLITLVLSFLVLGNLYTYKRFALEKPIAQLTFTPVSHQEFDATLSLGNFCEKNTYRIYGDEWRIDAQFLKWKSWATFFGLDAMYRMDRLSGRYANLEEELSKSHSAHELKTRSTLDLGTLAERNNNKFPPVDTVYGSSAYEKMKANTIYTVFVNQSGILVREQALTASDQIDECVASDSKWKDTIVLADQKLKSFITSIRTQI